MEDKFLKLNLPIAANSSHILKIQATIPLIILDYLESLYKYAVKIHDRYEYHNRSLKGAALTLACHVVVKKKVAGKNTQIQEATLEINPRDELAVIHIRYGTVREECYTVNFPTGSLFGWTKDVCLTI